MYRFGSSLKTMFICYELTCLHNSQNAMDELKDPVSESGKDDKHVLSGSM